MLHKKSFIAVVFMGFASAAAVSGQVSTQKLAAPQVTVGADIKLLRFDWDPVPGAQHYRLLKNPDGQSGFNQVGNDIPRSGTTAVDRIAVHLHDWVDARYIVAACNSSGCTNSAEISTNGVMLEAIGYLKSSQPQFGDFFGEQIALSADGRTASVSSRDPAGGPTGSLPSGAVRIFRRAGDSWVQDAFAFLQVRQESSSFGFSTALSADGTVLAVGAVGYDIPGGPTVVECDEGGVCRDVAEHGAVHIFHRTSQGWMQQALLQASPLQPGGRFGFAVSLSADGRTIAVDANDGFNQFGSLKTVTYVLRRTASGWQQVAAIRPEHDVDVCSSATLSADGKTLFTSCRFGDPQTGFPTQEQAIAVRVRSGDSWPLVSSVPFAIATNSPFDDAFCVNGPGTILAVREFVGSATVSIYSRPNATSNVWTLRQRIFGNLPGFGRDMSFSANGNVLAIGDFREASAGAGVLEAPVPGGVQAGGVFLYQRSQQTWTLKSVVKASNPDDGDQFGLDVALSENGDTLLVGADAERSAASGINGDQTDNSLSAAGAAYLY